MLGLNAKEQVEKSVCKPDVNGKMTPKKPIKTQLVNCQQINQLHFGLNVFHFWVVVLQD